MDPNSVTVCMHLVTHCFKISKVRRIASSRNDSHQLLDVTTMNRAR